MAFEERFVALDGVAAFDGDVVQFRGIEEEKRWLLGENERELFTAVMAAGSGGLNSS